MKLRFLTMALLPVLFAFASCDRPGAEIPKDDPEKPNLPTFEFPFFEEYPIEAGNLIAEGSNVGVTIEVTKVEDQNFVFELRPGAMVQSYKLDVYPLANLYNTLLNTKNSGKLTTGDPVAVNELIRELLFIDGAGGFSFSVNDEMFGSHEDFMQIEYDWMNTLYAASSAIAVPDCDFLIAVLSSTEPEITSANHEELTLCFVHTTSQPLVGDPQVSIDVNAGYASFVLQHNPNDDAAGVYYYAGEASGIEEYITTFGDVMFRDFIRTVVASPVASDDVDGLLFSYDFGAEEVAIVENSACAVAVDANLTPQEGYVRKDFRLKDAPEEAVVAEPRIVVPADRIAASYFEFYAELPMHCKTIFWSVFTPEEKEALDNGPSIDRKRKVVDLVNKGYGAHNENFDWDEANEKPIGESDRVKIQYLCPSEEPGSTIYIGYVGRNGSMQYSDLLWSEPITLDERNYTTPADCKVKDLKLWLDEPSRASFKLNLTYDPSTVSVVHVQYVPALIPEDPEDDQSEKKPWQEVWGLTVESPWEKWLDLLFDISGDMTLHSSSLNMNHWQTTPEGTGSEVFEGMQPGTEYTVFLCAEDFDGNISPMMFADIMTKEILVGPDPTVNMEVKEVEGVLKVVWSIDHDVEYFKYTCTDNVDDLNIRGANRNSLNNMVESGISYETWRDAIYEWTYEQGLPNENFETTSLPLSEGKVNVAACVAAGKDADGNPCYKMNTLIIKDGKAQTLEEVFGIQK